MSQSRPQQEQQYEEPTASHPRTEPEGEANTDVEETEPELEPLPLDQVFDLLKNERRRLVLSYLKERDEPASTSDLAEFVAAHETNKTIGQITSNERKRAYVGLYQCHLPKMDSMGVIEFNKPRGIAKLGPHADVVDPYLEVTNGGAPGNESTWPVRYLALSVAALALLVFGVAAGGLVLQLAFAGVVGVLGGTSLLHWRTVDSVADEG